MPGREDARGEGRKGGRRRREDGKAEGGRRGGGDSRLGAWLSEESSRSQQELQSRSRRGAVGRDGGEELGPACGGFAGRRRGRW